MPSLEQIEQVLSTAEAMQEESAKVESVQCIAVVLMGDDYIVIMNSGSV